MPATSPAVSSSTVALKPLRSQYFRYWRSSMPAQSQASVPPAPAWMSMKQLQRVGRVAEHAAELELLDRLLRSSCGLGLDGAQAGDVAFGLAHLVQLGVVGEVAGQVVDGADHVFERLLLAAQFLGALGFVPDARGSPARR